MGKIFNFVSLCEDCKNRKNYICITEKYLKDKLKVAIQIEQCPYFEEVDEE